MQALLGQTTKNVQDTRAQLEALREQGSPPVRAPPIAGQRVVERHVAARGAGLPGPSTLFITAKDQLDNRAYSTARSGFEQLLSAYPNADEAPACVTLHRSSRTGGDGNLGRG